MGRSRLWTQPVRQDNHIKWTSVQEKLLIDLYDKGYDLGVIGKHVGKSAHAVSGKLERMGFRLDSSGRHSPSSTRLNKV